MQKQKRLKKKINALRSNFSNKKIRKKFRFRGEIDKYIKELEKKDS